MQKRIVIVRQRVWPVSKAVVPLFIGVACLWILSDQLTAQTLANIAPTLKSLSTWQWIAGLIATGVSFWALGRYDVIIHRQFNTGCPAHRASIVGAASIAVGQLVGMGVLSGALVRWRMLPDLSLINATKIAFAVTLSFFIGLGFSAAVISLVFPVPYAPSYIVFSFIILFIILVLASFFREFNKGFLSRLRLPPLPAITGLIGLTLLDTTAAACALYFLMPETAGIGISELMPAYLVALSVALITGTPGGVGPFELTILALLPNAPEADVMAGIIAFRLIYYALPALIAALVLCRPFDDKTPSKAAPTLIIPGLDASEFTTGPRAELGVCRQNNACLLQSGTARLAVVSTPQTETALFDPISGRPGFDPNDLLTHAKNRNKLACFYKISARFAARLRQRGLKTLHIADEAVLDPSRFTAHGSSFRQLRRKLGKAKKAGVVIHRSDHHPLPDLARIDHQWQQQNGRARGFSMGQYCPDYIQGQRIYFASQDAEIIAYISLHIGPDELCLDLMRAGWVTPDGTMHMLIMAAIKDAACEGRTRLSLAALPPHTHSKSKLGPLINSMITSLSGGPGLSQFKTCFKPRLEPLYAAAFSWPALMLALLDLNMTIRHPNTNPAQKDHEEFAFARSRET